MSRKTRAVLLPTIGDPYRAGIFLSAYRKHIKKEVDKLYVNLNSNVDMAVLDYVADLYRAEGAEVIVRDHHTSSACLIKELIENCKEDLAFLIEDDFYIVAPGHINRWFSMIEDGTVDAVGSPRGCCSAEMMKRTTDFFSLTKPESEGTNFWPVLYIGRVADLLGIREKEYGAYTHPAGTYIPELDWTVDKDEPGDVFVWASVQLRALGLKFHIEDQGNWIDIYIRKQPMPWIHTGAGSSSFLNHLITSDGKSIGVRNDIGKRKLCTLQDDHILWVTETKQAVWELILEYFPIPASSPAAYFNNVYADALQHSRDTIRTVSGKRMRDVEIHRMRVFYESLLAPILN